LCAESLDKHRFHSLLWGIQEAKENCEKKKQRMMIRKYINPRCEVVNKMIKKN
jgi:hypothetical protein